MHSHPRRACSDLHAARPPTGHCIRASHGMPVLRPATHSSVRPSVASGAHSPCRCTCWVISRAGGVGWARPLGPLRTGCWCSTLCDSSGHSAPSTTSCSVPCFVQLSCCVCLNECLAVLSPLCAQHSECSHACSTAIQSSMMLLHLLVVAAGRRALLDSRGPQV
jgi:hypothetical protein